MHQSIAIFLCISWSVRITHQTVFKPSLRSITVNPVYSKWPGKRVPYYIDSSYSAATADLIRASAQKVSDDLSSCVAFVEVGADSAEYKVHVTNKMLDGKTLDPVCSSHPGIINDFKKRGLKGQRIVITNGPTGCLDGSKHSVMKFWAIVLGKLNEHQRSDRDQYIKINTANVLPDTDNIFHMHKESEQHNSYPYDYCSITHNQPEEFAKNKTEAFIVKQAPLYIPKLNRLSEYDCKELSTLYGCDPSKCQPLDCTDLNADKQENAEGEQEV